MSKVYDEITFLPNEAHSDDGEACLLERPDRALARGAFVEEEPGFRVLDPTSRGQSLIPAAPTEIDTNAPQDDVGDKLVSSSAAASPNAKAFSRDLVDTYFRQMGDAAWLSRDEESALAKRIEESQRALLAARSDAR
jgi:hypothetical protein